PRWPHGPRCVWLAPKAGRLRRGWRRNRAGHDLPRADSVFGSCSWLPPQELLDLPHDLRDPQLLLEDVVGQLLRRQVLEVLLRAGVLDVEVATVGQDVRRRHLPGAVVRFPLLPPLHARLELLDL